MTWSYSELQAKVAGWLHRDNLTSEIQDAIMLFESELNSRVRHHSMLQLSTLTLPAGDTSKTLPADFLALHTLTFDGNGYGLRQTPLKYLDSYDTSLVAYPVYYSVTNGAVEFRPAGVQDYDFKLRYYAAVGLSNSIITNWLLEKYPHIYLFGALFYMLEFITDIERKGSVQAKHEMNMAFLEGAGGFDVLAEGDSAVIPENPIG